MSLCPKHKDAPDVASCRMCAAWHNLEKEKKRLGLQRERLHLDMQLLKAEKKNHRRSAQVSAQSQSTSLAKLEIQLQQQKAKQKKQVDELTLLVKKEEEDRKIQGLEWKLKFTKQESDLQEEREKVESLQDDHDVELITVKEEKEKELEAKLKKTNDTHMQQLHEREQEKQEVQKQNERLTVQVSNHAKDIEAQQDELDELQDELAQVKIEKDNIFSQMQELEEKCQTMEEEHEEALAEAMKAASSNDANGTGPLPLQSSAAVGDCTNCEDLEEEIYELKLKMNKRRIEHEKATKKLQEELNEAKNGNSKAERTIETVGTAIAASAATSTFISAKDQQELRKIETDKRKVESKFLALEARQKTTDREKEAIEEDLKAAKADTYELALELETVQKELNQQKSQQMQFNEEGFRTIKEQIDILQRQQETYVARHQADSIEWNELIESLGQKQRQVFDATLPAMTTKVTEIERQLKEVENMKFTTPAPVPAEKPPPPPDTERQDRRNSRRVSERQPPLTKVDSRKNRHVTEFDFLNDKQKGKYTGFLNMQNLPDGHGILRVDNGDVYEGEWENGHRQGQGVYTWYEGDLYTGPWYEGRRHGHGVFVFSDGRLYDGEYQYGARDGQGMFVWPYGAKYEGSYIADKRNGLGEYVYADGRKYRGDYKEDRPHGYGVEMAKDGAVIYEGSWAFGEFVGDGGSVAGSIADSVRK